MHSSLRPAELGPELAVGLGCRPAPTRVFALGIGTILAAAATAVAGPLAFVALLSTPIATALGRGRPHLVTAALTGALGAPAMLWILLRSRKDT